jgi:aspartate kinase
MAFYIQKFGGTSVADITCLQRVANIVKATVEAGHRTVVVVSAMAGETDRLTSLIHQAAPNLVPRESAACLAAGEQVSSALLAMILCQAGVKAQSVNAFQMQLITSGGYCHAHTEGVSQDYFNALYQQGTVPVIAGFQGLENNNFTTLGRGGSDTSAVALAAFLQADECHIYTDVKGVYSADPRIVHDAYLLKTISYDEMLTLAELGAKVLQKRSVEMARKYNVPVRVLSSFEKDGVGTLVKQASVCKEGFCVSGVACVEQQVKVTMQNILAQQLKSVLDLLKKKKIDVDLYLEEVIDGAFVTASFLMHEAGLPQLCQFTRDIHVESGLAKVSLVGREMSSHAEFSMQSMHALLEKDIVIHNIVSSPTKVSISVNADQLISTANELHALFAAK